MFDLNSRRQEMLKVLSVVPDLTPNGMKSDRATLGYDYKGKSEELLLEQSLQQFSTCKDWLSKVVKTRSFNLRYTSYGYKHMVERWADLYVSNGAFIAAAIALEFKIKRTHSKSPNIFLPISSKSVKEMKEREKKILHNCSGY
jgi:hypothetical protein